ncbi:MAG: carboxypeptidase regulatory-like domain-containing protein, partial [Candidatus Hydrogenedentes bacterium]|nr:carboxypeptidase regulatory-like domain-containing protein [Candidatus Hydrogenedentota bacterium]
ITSAQPPQDSALTFTDTQGKFSIRLKPGNYIYRATAIGWQSPGWTDLSVTGNGPLARTRLIVSRTGSIQGTVKDAKTGQGIPGARLSLECNGNAAAVVRTGAGGDYSVEAVEGDNVLRLESAPGYLPPAEGPIRIALHEAEAKTLPDLWLLPLPVWRVQVLGHGGQPAPGVIVSLLRPAQVGWRVTGPEGWVELDVENVPPDGKIVGLAEAIQEPLGALFQIAASQGEPGPVQLLPLGTVRGRVVDKEGNALEGAAVGAVFPGETAAEELMLWRSISGDEGAFVWESVVPGVPQLCIARAGAAPQAQSPPFNLAPGTSHDLGALTLAGGQKEKTLYGRPLAWRELPVVMGELPPERELRGRPALVIFCGAAETEAVLAALALPAFQDLVQESPLITAVVTSVPVGPGAAPCVVLRGAAPTHATTYLCDASGNVVLQTFGMPPLRGLQKLLVESKSVGSD